MATSPSLDRRPMNERRNVLTPEALLPAITAQSVAGPAQLGYQRSGFYGHGFNVGKKFYDFF